MNNSQNAQAYDNFRSPKNQKWLVHNNYAIGSVLSDFEPMYCNWLSWELDVTPVA